MRAAAAGRRAGSAFLRARPRWCCIWRARPSRVDLLARLGKHTTGKGCLYVNRLADVDPGVLEQLARDSFAWMNQAYPD